MPRHLLPVLLVLLALLPEAAAGDDRLTRLTAGLVAAGFENVAVATGPVSRVEVRFENRVERWELVAIGRVARAAMVNLDVAAGGDSSTGPSELAITPLVRGIPVRTLVASAADWGDFLDGRTDAPTFQKRIRILDPGPWPPTAGSAPAALNSSRWRADVALRPLMELQLGIADDPFETALFVAPELIVSPARSVLLTLQARIELQDDLDDFNSPLAPGRNTLSWNSRLPGGIEVAASGGTFPENRYGFVAEAGRLLDRRGLIEARLGGDWSGFYKFLDGGTISYSDLGAWSGVGTLIGRLPGRDLELSIAGGHFLSGDEGVRIDAVRRFGEVDLGFFGISTGAGDVGGFRFSVPLPARHYSLPRRVRPTTVPVFPFEYREDVAPVGQRVRAYDTIDRFRRALVPTFVLNNVEAIRGGSVTERYRSPGGPTRAIAAPRPGLGGTTGLINTPTPHVAEEGSLHVGYSHIPRKWSYEGRSSLRNDYVYLTTGFLPYVEASLRGTVLPGEYLIDDVPVDAVDRMGSFRIQSPWPRGRTTLGMGMDDVRGTRRFHSLYLVASQSIEPGLHGVAAEVVGGYGLRTLSAPRYLLDGVFGGMQIKLLPWAGIMAEYDSEKWNGGIRLDAFSRLSTQLAMLNFESLSVGATWSVRF